MARILVMALLLLPFFAVAQSTEKAITVIYRDGDTRAFRLTNYKDVMDAHRFILTDPATGDKVVVTPDDVEVVLLQGAVAWVPAIVELDGSPNELTYGELSAGTSTYPSRTDTVFLLSEFRGEAVSLYSVRIDEREHLFLSKRKGSYQELIHKRILPEGRGVQSQQDYNGYQAQLAEAVARCRVMANATPSVAFDVGSIVKFLQAFEMDCLKNGDDGSRSGKPEKPLLFSLMAGYSWNRPNFASDNPSDLIPPGPVRIAGTPSFGLSLMVRSPYGKRRVATGTDMYYNHFRAHADTTWMKGGTPQNHTSKGLDYSISSIRLALLGQYDLLTRSKLRPFIKAGFAFGYVVSSYASSTTYTYRSGILEESQSNDPFKAQGFNSFQLGFTAGAGVDVSRISLQYKFETTGGYVTTVSTGSSLAVHSIFISYRIN